MKRRRQKIGEDQIFYLQQRGISKEEAVAMIINGFCKTVFRELPMEFAWKRRNYLASALRECRISMSLLEIKKPARQRQQQRDFSKALTSGECRGSAFHHGAEWLRKSTLAQVLARREKLFRKRRRHRLQRKRLAGDEAGRSRV